MLVPRFAQRTIFLKGFARTTDLALSTRIAAGIVSHVPVPLLGHGAYGLSFLDLYFLPTFVSIVASEGWCCW